jgi:hypothetical protein
MKTAEISQSSSARTKYIALFNLVGLALIGISFSWHCDGLSNPAAVIQRTINSPLSHPLDWGAIWCSIRVMLWGVGLFLIADALATSAMVYRLKKLATCLYCLLASAGLVFLFGTFMLVHSIL